MPRSHSLKETGKNACPTGLFSNLLKGRRCKEQRRRNMAASRRGRDKCRRRYEGARSVVRVNGRPVRKKNGSEDPPLQEPKGRASEESKSRFLASLGMTLVGVNGRLFCSLEFVRWRN